MEKVVVSKEWKISRIIQVYKGKGDRSGCTNYRYITRLGIPEKLYGKVLIKSIKGSLVGEH